MTTTLRILILAIGATLFASCSDSTFGDDAESYEGLECWSEPDIKIPSTATESTSWGTRWAESAPST